MRHNEKTRIAVVKAMTLLVEKMRLAVNACRRVRRNNQSRVMDVLAVFFGKTRHDHCIMFLRHCAKKLYCFAINRFGIRA